MKIIAIIPKPHCAPRYIAEIEAPEVGNLTLLTSTYEEVAVTDQTGKTVSRAIQELQVGDVIDPDVCKQRRDAFAQYVNAREEVEKSMSSLRGAMTKLSNLTAPKTIP